MAIDLSPNLNPARYPAMHHAQLRANRERVSMNVFIGPPNVPQVLTPTGCNVWFVRPVGEDTPKGNGVELYATVNPESQ